MKNTSLLSLLLLFLSYCVSGWLLPTTRLYWWTWLLAVIIVIIFTFILTSPLQNIDSYLTKLSSGKNKTFLLAIFFAFSAVIILRWINITGRILLVLTATTLARLDLQNMGYNAQKSFFILLSCSLLGLAVGLGLHLAFIAKLIP
jgi:hypothetical protein